MTRVALVAIAGALLASVVVARAASPPPLRLVAIGDSTPHASDCPGCTDYVALYASDLAKAMGRRVQMDNRAAIELSNVPAVEATELYARLLTDSSLRHAVAAADVVVVSVGFNDTPWNRLDDPCNAAPNYPRVSWQKITPACTRLVTTEYKQTLDEILTQIDELRGCGEQPGVPPCSQRYARDTLIRVVTVYNSTIGDKVDPGWDSRSAARATVLGNRLFASAQCEVAHFHGGRCADILHALNGRSGTSPAGPFLASDYTHLSQRGHRLVAMVLARLGYAPLAR